MLLDAGLADLATFAIAAVMLHCLTYGLGKGLMLVGAGEVGRITGSTNLNHLGGLMAHRPLLGVGMIIGAASLVALPPLAGFTSEWAILKSVISAAGLPSPTLRLFIPIALVVIAMGVAILAVAYTKAVGMVFLGRPRQPEREVSKAVARGPSAIVAITAVLIILLGVAPGFVWAMLIDTSATVVGFDQPAFLASSPIGLTPTGFGGVVVLALVLSAAVLLTLIAVSRSNRDSKNDIRHGAAWDFGFPEPEITRSGGTEHASAQFSAASYSEPVERIFAGRLLSRGVHIDLPGRRDRDVGRLTTTKTNSLSSNTLRSLSEYVKSVVDRAASSQDSPQRRGVFVGFVGLAGLLLLALLLERGL